MSNVHEWMVTPAVRPVRSTLKGRLGYCPDAGRSVERVQLCAGYVMGFDQGVTAGIAWVQLGRAGCAAGCEQGVGGVWGGRPGRSRRVGQREPNGRGHMSAR